MVLTEAMVELTKVVRFAMMRGEGGGPSAADSLTCPIGLEEFTNPVVASDGWIYERSNILRHHAVSVANSLPMLSPMSRQNLCLLPNG